MEPTDRTAAPAGTDTAPDAPVRPALTRRRFVAAAAFAAAGAFAMPAAAHADTLFAILRAGLNKAGALAAPGAVAQQAALPDEEPWQTVLRIVRNAARARLDAVSVSYGQADVLRAMRAFEYEPLSFYLDDQPKLSVNGLGVATVALTYRFTPEEEAEVLARCDATAAQLLAAIPDDADAWTRALLAHDLLAAHVHAATEEDSYVDEAGTVRYDDRFRRLDTALLDGVAVCQGYAVAYQYLLEKLGVPCDVVVSRDHAWNTVELDGALYHVDTTYDDIDEPDPWGGAYVTRARFMMNDTDLAAFGLEVSQTETPCGPSKDTAACFYNRTGYLADAFDPDAIAALWAPQVQAGARSLAVRFADDASYRACLDSFAFNPGALVRMVDEASGWQLLPASYLGTDAIRAVDVFLKPR